MYRKFLWTTLAALMIALSWGAAPLYAQRLLPSLRPDRPRPALRQAGLLVTGVLPGSTAAEQGIEPGDVIVAVNGAPVCTSADLARAIGWSSLPAELEIIDCRTGWQHTLVIYPDNGRIGVFVQPLSPRGVRPIPPIGPGPVWPIPPIGPGPIRPIPPIGPGPIRPIPLPLPVPPGSPRIPRPAFPYGR